MKRDNYTLDKAYFMAEQRFESYFIPLPSCKRKIRTDKVRLMIALMCRPKRLDARLEPVMRQFVEHAL